MTWHHLLHWWPSRATGQTRRARAPQPRWRFARPCLEALEDRTAPASVSASQWANGSGPGWTTGNRGSAPCLAPVEGGYPCNGAC